MADSRYTFDSQPNSYFLGTDLRVTDGTGRTIIVNVKDDMWAVNVKDHVIARNYPADVRAAMDDLFDLGGEAVEALYQSIQQQFWEWAGDLAERYGFGGIAQVGHSGGWLAVEGSTQRFPEIIEPDSPEALESRDAFLALAFEAVESIDDGWRPQFFEDVKAAAAEPVYTCPNCGLADTNLLGRKHTDSGCVLAALLSVIRDRGDIEIDQAKVAEVDCDALWGLLGKIADTLEDEVRV